MPFVAPLAVLALATGGFFGGDFVATRIARTSDGTVDQLGNRMLAGGLGMTAASAAALVMGGPVVAALAVGAGVAGIGATLGGAKVKWGDPAEAARIASMIDPAE